MPNIDLDTACAEKWLGVERAAHLSGDVRAMRRETQRAKRAKAAADRRTRHAAITSAQVVDLPVEIADAITQSGKRVKSRITRHPLCVVAGPVETPYGTVVRIIWDDRLGVPFPGQRVIEEQVQSIKGMRLHYYRTGQAGRMGPVEDMEQFAAMQAGGGRNPRLLAE